MEYSGLLFAPHADNFQQAIRRHDRCLRTAMKPITSIFSNTMATLLATLLCLSGSASAGEQRVTPFPLSQQVAPADAVTITVTYASADPNDMKLPGLGLRLHWSSSQLDFLGIGDILPTGLVGQGAPEVDSEDFDGDPATDRYLLLAWADPSAAWPGTGPGAVALFSVQFQPTSGFSGAVLRFSSPSTAAGYTLAAAQAQLRLGDDGDLEVIFEDGYEGADGSGWRLLLEIPQG